MSAAGGPHPLLQFRPHRPCGRSRRPDQAVRYRVIAVPSRSSCATAAFPASTEPSFGAGAVVYTAGLPASGK
jgi:hypothetical protein